MRISETFSPGTTRPPYRLVVADGAVDDRHLATRHIDRAALAIAPYSPVPSPHIGSAGLARVSLSARASEGLVVFQSAIVQRKAAS